MILGVYWVGTSKETKQVLKPILKIDVEFSARAIKHCLEFQEEKKFHMWLIKLTNTFQHIDIEYRYPHQVKSQTQATIKKTWKMYEG